jgi:arylsulfatase A-like enzyme
LGLAALGLVSSVGCRGPQDTLALADFVDHQKGNLATDVISPAESRGVGALAGGWRLDDDEEGQPIATMPHELSRIRLFSPDGSLEAVELELGLAPGVGDDTAEMTVNLNRQSLGVLDVQKGWSTHRLGVPAGMVRAGLNALDLRAKGTGGKVRLRRAVMVPGGGRPPWPKRPDRIRVGPGRGEAGGGRTVVMPTASVLDMVLRVPVGGRLVGGFTVEPAAGLDFTSVEVSVRLLDEGSEEHTLLREVVPRDLKQPRRVDVDLARWSGTLARLRWQVRGPGNALVRWHGAGVGSPAPGPEPPPLPIPRVAPDRSGRLGHPDVILILLDAARADVLFPFRPAEETPAVARLARQGTVFRHASAGSSWTLQSVTGLLTGLYADTLGVWAWRDRLPAAAPSLPELMRSAGYDTFLFSQHPFYRYDDSYRRGFERVLTLKGDDAATLPSRRLIDPDRPTFSLVHLLPPHIPYTPPEPFRGRYTANYEGEMRVDPKHLRTFGPKRPDRPGETDLRYVFDRYRENVAYADRLVARVLGILERHDRYDDALVVLTADHGEAFLEHGRFVHSLDLYREVLHVPLVIKWPRSLEGFRSEVDGPVSLLDLLPTLVDGLSLEGADDGFQGRSLLPLIFGEPAARRSFYAVTRGEGSPNREAEPRLMLEQEGWRVHVAPLEGRVELYDVERDPGERVDRAPERPLEALRLRQSLLIQSSWNRDLLEGDTEDRPTQGLDPEELEQLEALGYLN